MLNSAPQYQRYYVIFCTLQYVLRYAPSFVSPSGGWGGPIPSSSLMLEDTGPLSRSLLLVFLSCGEDRHSSETICSSWVPVPPHTVVVVASEGGYFSAPNT